jgi:hypothetical protein
MLRLIRRGGPALCNIAVTNSCNAACDFCNFARGKVASRDLRWIDADQFGSALDILHKSVSAMTHDGRMLRMLTLIDEYTRECLAIRVARRLGRYEVIEALADVMLFRRIPENIRSTMVRSSWRKS